jgi:hypothetical protein
MQTGDLVLGRLPGFEPLDIGQFKKPFRPMA